MKDNTETIVSEAGVVVVRLECGRDCIKKIKRSPPHFLSEIKSFLNFCDRTGIVEITFKLGHKKSLKNGATITEIKIMDFARVGSSWRGNKNVELAIEEIEDIVGEAVLALKRIKADRLCDEYETCLENVPNLWTNFGCVSCSK